MSDRPYTKVLVAKFSPKNGCNVANGQPLFVRPKTDVPLKDNVSHQFVSTVDPSATSKYGWVHEVSPFSLDDFIATHIGRDLTPEEREHLQVMLDSIQGLKTDTPVAATYSARGLGNRRMEFTVHKVFFHPV